jgi:hypothetical protein
MDRFTRPRYEATATGPLGSAVDIEERADPGRRQESDLTEVEADRVPAETELFVDGRLEFGGSLGVDPSAGDEIDSITVLAGDGRFKGESHGRSAVSEPLS